jgi:NAD(P)H-dependent flavin oxidoreductase YrpB (nitropropane dioxygenase family)
MAGGPSVPGFVQAAASAGCLGFLAGGYKSAEALASQIAEVRATTEAVGVNLFAPNPLPVDRDAFRRYAEALQPVADRYGIDLAAREPVEDDDAWSDKVDLLLTSPVPVVSFTFGVPDASVVAALRRVGTLTVQTITSTSEVSVAVASGVDMLAVQSSAAGGHRGVLHPELPSDETPLPELVAAVRRTTSLPVLAAGGISTPEGVATTMAAGAVGVIVGTVLLRAAESGTSPVHRAAIGDHSRETVVTRAFTGRPARGLRNEFVDRFGAIAPLGYPALHHLTSSVRRASAAAGDPELVNLWAGTGFRDAMPEPVGTILRRLATGD